MAFTLIVASQAGVSNSNCLLATKKTFRSLWSTYTCKFIWL